MKKFWSIYTERLKTPEEHKIAVFDSFCGTKQFSAVCSVILVWHKNIISVNSELISGIASFPHNGNFWRLPRKMIQNHRIDMTAQCAQFEVQTFFQQDKTYFSFIWGKNVLLRYFLADFWDVPIWNELRVFFSIFSENASKYLKCLE